jgi:sigma-B regulation protein RsbU (phosphoserine phosphatase)
LDDARFNRIGVLQTISAAASGSLQLFHIADIEIGKNDIAMGLETGADDFLAKPVNAHELRARITAGERILSMERELHSRNAIITDTLSELRKLYHAIDIDLIEAKKLQHSLIREPNVSVGSYKITQFLQSAGHVGGDLVGLFPAGERHLGLF